MLHGRDGSEKIERFYEQPRLVYVWRDSAMHIQPHYEAVPPVKEPFMGVQIFQRTRDEDGFIHYEELDPSYRPTQ